MQKIKNIEFLRTFLICGIVMLHMFLDRKWCLCTLFPDISIYQTLHHCFGKSNNGVEGFFIIAGFLLFITFNAKTTINDFIKKKYIRLSPVILFSILICFVGWLLNTMHFNFFENLITILLLNQFGICISVGQNTILWYTSALFSGLLVYFSILKFAPEKYRTKIIFTLIILAYGILEILQHGTFAKPLVNYYIIFNVGFMRSIGGLGVGCLIGYYTKSYSTYVQNLVLSKTQKLLLSLCELFLLSFIVWWMTFYHLKINNIVFVIIFAFLLILFILKKGYISNILENDFWVKLGKYQYSIYVVHYVIIKIFGFALWKQHPEFVVSHPIIPIITMLITIILIGVFTYHFIEEPCARYLKKKLLPQKV